MKVCELIQLLETLPQDADIYHSEDTGEENSTIGISTCASSEGTCYELYVEYID